MRMISVSMRQLKYAAHSPSTKPIASAMTVLHTPTTRLVRSQ